MYVQITDTNKDKAQVISNSDNFIKVIPHIMLQNGGAIIALIKLSILSMSRIFFFGSEFQIRGP